jgi:hypothetical protein
VEIKFIIGYGEKQEKWKKARKFFNRNFLKFPELYSAAQIRNE